MKIKHAKSFTIVHNYHVLFSLLVAIVGIYNEVFLKKWEFFEVKGILNKHIFYL